MNYPSLHFQEIAPGQPFHGALVRIPSDGVPEVRRHGHDFFEFVILLAGNVRHWVNDRETDLQAGQIALIRPSDVHGMLPCKGIGSEFVNVAFPEEVWADFVTATGIADEAQAWTAEPRGMSRDLLPHQSEPLRRAALACVRSYHDGPTRLAFCAFWSAAVGALLGSHSGSPDAGSQPLWLRNACDWAQSTDVDELSLDGLVAASRVSFGHLCRTMKATLGVTPTAFLNELRVKCSAYLLATTDREIAAICFDCGFESLSYFYRRFHQVTGKSPRRYREDARLPVAPESKAMGTKKPL